MAGRLKNDFDKGGIVGIVMSWQQGQIKGQLTVVRLSRCSTGQHLDFEVFRSAKKGLDHNSQARV